MPNPEGTPKDKAPIGPGRTTPRLPASRRPPWFFLGIVNLIVFLLILLLGLRVFVMPRYFPRAAALIPLPQALMTPTENLQPPTQAPVIQQATDLMNVLAEGEKATITPAPTLSGPTQSAPSQSAPDDSSSITPAPTMGIATPLPLNTPLPGESNDFLPQPGSPFYIRGGEATNGSATCESVNIAGQVFQSDGTPLQEITVQVSGWLGEQKINATAMTGTALLYGPAGYEIQISNTPLLTEKTLTVQIFDQQGAPLSPKVYFNTYKSCEKNLAIVNFIQSSR